MRLLCLLLVLPLAGCEVRSAADPGTDAEPVRLIAAQGRIEGASQTIDLGYPGTALVGEILAHEGQPVRRGQTLIRMDCQVLSGELQAAAAEQSMAEEDLARLMRGARTEEIQVAEAEAQEAKAVHAQAVAHLERVSEMRKKSFSSADDLDSVRRDLAVAAARKEAAAHRLALLMDGALPEEIRRAEQAIAAAGARREAIRARLDKCDIVSPVDGVVLRLHVEKGELVSELKPIPVVSVVDLGRLRVRAEIDELDIGQVSVGQHARVVADAFEGTSIDAVVEELSLIMGRKQVRSRDPADKSDRDVLEVLLALGEGRYSLPVGLRVTVLLSPDREKIGADAVEGAVRLGAAARYSMSAPDEAPGL